MKTEISSGRLVSPGIHWLGKIRSFRRPCNKRSCECRDHLVFLLVESSRSTAGLLRNGGRRQPAKPSSLAHTRRGKTCLLLTQSPAFLVGVHCHCVPCGCYCDLPLRCAPRKGHMWHTRVYTHPRHVHTKHYTRHVHVRSYLPLRPRTKDLGESFLEKTRK